MTLRCKQCCYYILIITACILQCCLWEPGSAIPEDQAKIIRQILRENGYSIDDDENVDPFLEFSSSSEHVELKERYWLLLPEKKHRILVLSDYFNKLDRTLFIGVKTYSYARKSTIAEKNLVDSIVIKSDSFINVGYLEAMSNNINIIPTGISQIRAGFFNFNSNNLETFPEEFIQVCNPPIFYDSVRVDIDFNNIDTLTISDTLKTWLVEHAKSGANWWRLQERYPLPKRIK